MNNFSDQVAINAYTMAKLDEQAAMLKKKFILMFKQAILKYLKSSAMDRILIPSDSIGAITVEDLIFAASFINEDALDKDTIIELNLTGLNVISEGEQNSIEIPVTIQSNIGLIYFRALIKWEQTTNIAVDSLILIDP